MTGLAACLKDEKREQKERQQLAAQYAREGMALLTRARTDGFFFLPVSVEKLEKEQDFEPFRSQEDFKKLLAEIRKK